MRVEGIVDSEERKQEFLRALGPVSNNPAVKIDIHTVTETLKPGADDELRAYFEKQSPSGPTDDAIRKYSSRRQEGPTTRCFTRSN